MKRKFTYFTVDEERGTCGYCTDRLVSGDGKCDKAVGFDTLRAARAFVKTLADAKRKEKGVRKVELVENRPDLFELKYEAKKVDEWGAYWYAVSRSVRIEAHDFALFTAGEVATRMVKGY